jgi:hypothetical protein
MRNIFLSSSFAYFALSCSSGYLCNARGLPELCDPESENFALFQTHFASPSATILPGRNIGIEPDVLHRDRKTDEERFAVPSLSHVEPSPLVPSADELPPLLDKFPRITHSSSLPQFDGLLLIPCKLTQQSLFCQNISPLDLQRAIVNQQDPKDPKVVELDKLTQKGLVLTSDSLNEHSDCFQSALINIDIFDVNNFLVATKLAIENVTDPSNLDFSISAKFASNPQLRDYFSYILLQLDIMQHLPVRSLSDKDFAKAFMNLLKTLKESNLLLRYNYAIPASYPFTNFIYNAVRVQQVMLARYVTNQVFENLRGSVEQDVLSQTNSADVSLTAGVEGVVPGVDVALANTAFTNSGTTSSSFYTVNIGDKSRISITADAKIAGIEAGVSCEAMKSLVFYSLEQLIDSGTPNIVIAPADLKRLIANRSEMQERERELLRRFGELEGFYKICHVIPQRAYIDWVDISGTAPIDTTSTYSISGDIATKLAQMCEISLVRTISEKFYKQHKGMLSLLTNDCNVARGLTQADVECLLGEEYNISKQIGSVQMLYGSLVAYNAILEQLANDHATTAAKELKKSKHEYEKLLLPKSGFFGPKIPGRKGVLRAGVTTACAMREASTNPEERVIFRKLHTQLERLRQLSEFAQNKRHQISVERVVKGKSVSTSGVLNFEIPLIGTIKTRLSLYSNSGSPFLDENGDFAEVRFVVPKSNSVVDAALGLTQKMKKFADKVKEVSQEQLFAELANVAESGSAFLDIAKSINSESTVDSLVSWIPGIFSDGAYEVAVKLKKIRANVGGDEAGGAGAGAGTGGVEVGAGAGAGVDGGTEAGGAEIGTGEGGAEASTSAEVANHSTVQLPLPKQKFIERTHDAWIPIQVQAIAGVSTHIGANFGVVGATVATNHGSVRNIVCGDSLCSIISKYNALRLGQSGGATKHKGGDGADAATTVDKSSISEPARFCQAWGAFLAAQSAPLCDVFVNICKDSSNARYELQCLFNDVMIGETDKELQATTKTFTKFLTACTELNAKIAGENLLASGEQGDSDVGVGGSSWNGDKLEKAISSAQYKKAVKRLNNVLEIVYQNSFLPHYTF